MTQIDTVALHKDEATNDTRVPYELDAGFGARATIGLVALASDQVIEHEFRTLLDVDGVALHQGRIANESTVTPDSLAAMEARLSRAVSRIVPGVPMNVVAYGCTSGTVVIGEERVFGNIGEVRPGVQCTTPISAARAAFAALGVRRIGVLTPYSDAVNRLLRAHLEQHGFSISALCSFYQEDDHKVARISMDSVRRAALALGRRDDVEAVFVSCTNLRFAAAVGDAERALGKPFTSSNHAMAWHCLRLAGIDDSLPHGSLYALA